MDPNSLFGDSAKVARHIQLYELAFKKKLEEPVEKKAVRRGPRREIEKDLLARHVKSQAKIHVLKLEQVAKQKELQPGVPRINTLSKCITSKAKDSEREKMKSGHISESLQGKMRRANANSKSVSMVSNENQSAVDIKIDLSRFSTSKDMSVVSQVPHELSPKHTPHGLSYSSFHHLLAGTPQVEASDPKFNSYFNLKGDIVSRTHVWSQQKMKKLAKKRRDKDDSEIEGCTFRPDLSYSPSPKHEDSTASKSSGYFSLAPSNTKVAYCSGINMAAFRNKAKPMVDYKTVSQKN